MKTRRSVKKCYRSLLVNHPLIYQSCAGFLFVSPFKSSRLAAFVKKNMHVGSNIRRFAPVVSQAENPKGLRVRLRGNLALDLQFPGRSVGAKWLSQRVPTSNETVEKVQFLHFCKSHT